MPLQRHRAWTRRGSASSPTSASIAARVLLAAAICSQTLLRSAASLEHRSGRARARLSICRARRNCGVEVGLADLESADRRRSQRLPELAGRRRELDRVAARRRPYARPAVLVRETRRPWHNAGPRRSGGARACRAAASERHHPLGRDRELATGRAACTGSSAAEAVHRAPDRIVDRDHHRAADAVPATL